MTTPLDDYYEFFDTALEAIYKDGDAIDSIKHDLKAAGEHLSQPLPDSDIDPMVHVAARAAARAIAIARLEQSMGFKVRIRPAAS